MSTRLKTLGIFLLTFPLSHCGDSSFRGGVQGEDSKGKDPNGANASDLNPDDVSALCATNGILLAEPLDFEDNSKQDSRIDFWSTHGMRFFTDHNGSLKRVKTTRLGDANPSADQRAWLCIKCDGSPNYNRLANAESEERIKDYALANTSALKTRLSGFRMEFKDPPSKVSFDLVDVDGGESWNFSVTDANGDVIADAEINGYASSSYDIDKSDNGKFKTFEVHSATSKIATIAIAGSKKSSVFGFALDNIDAGYDRCKNQ